MAQVLGLLPPPGIQFWAPGGGLVGTGYCTCVGSEQMNARPFYFCLAPMFHFTSLLFQANENKETFKEHLNLNLFSLSHL